VSRLKIKHCNLDSDRLSRFSTDAAAALLGGLTVGELVLFPHASAIFLDRVFNSTPGFGQVSRYHDPMNFNAG